MGEVDNVSEWKDPINRRALAPFFGAATLILFALVWYTSFEAFSTSGPVSRALLGLSVGMSWAMMRMCRRTWVELARTK